MCRRGGHEDFADQATVGAGLFRDQDIAQHGFGVVKDLLFGPADFHAALKAVLERAFATASGVDLRFDHHGLVALAEKFVGKVAGGFRGGADLTGGNGHTLLS